MSEDSQLYWICGECGQNFKAGETYLMVDGSPMHPLCALKTDKAGDK